MRKNNDGDDGQAKGWGRKTNERMGKTRHVRAKKGDEGVKPNNGGGGNEGKYELDGIQGVQEEATKEGEEEE